MFNRQQLRIHSSDMQRLVQSFTLSHRMWTAYTPDKLEHMMKFYKVLPEQFLYGKFDECTEELVFYSPPEFLWTRELINKECPMLPSAAKLLSR